jgi:hypothetical protein
MVEVHVEFFSFDGLGLGWAQEDRKSVNWAGWVNTGLSDIS